MNKLMILMRRWIQHYNEERYWKYRRIVINPNNNVPKLLKFLMLYYIKKSDAFNNSSMGTFINKGAEFKDIPNFPHGLYGIIISKNAEIGRNCTIFHHVTIGEGNGGAPCIGNNCYIGAGAKIVGNITVGNNVSIGANCIIVSNIPDNCTVVMEKPRIILKSK